MIRLLTQHSGALGAVHDDDEKDLRSGATGSSALPRAAPRIKPTPFQDDVGGPALQNLTLFESKSVIAVTVMLLADIVQNACAAFGVDWQ